MTAAKKRRRRLFLQQAMTMRQRLKQRRSLIKRHGMNLSKLFIGIVQVVRKSFLLAKKHQIICLVLMGMVVMGIQLKLPLHQIQENQLSTTKPKHMKNHHQTCLQEVWPCKRRLTINQPKSHTSFS